MAVRQLERDVERLTHQFKEADKARAKAELQANNLRKINDALVDQVEVFKAEAILGKVVIRAVTSFCEDHKQWLMDYPKVIQKDRLHNDVYALCMGLVGKL